MSKALYPCRLLSPPTTRLLVTCNDVELIVHNFNMSHFDWNQKVKLFLKSKLVFIQEPSIRHFITTLF